jgi:hypothetical protein
MDLTRSITYRNFNLNGRAHDSGILSGCQTDRLEWGAAAGVGYTEKRARDDGSDASDVFLGARRARLSGTLYGTSRGDLYDQIDNFLAAFTPTLAYRDSQDTHGYLPLTFYRPTALTDDFPTGLRELFINVRPLEVPAVTFIADRSGGGDDDPVGIQWSALIEARDPRVYLADPVEIDLSGDTNGDTGTLVNRGNYHSPLTIILVSDAGANQDFRFVGFGADLTVSIPDLADGESTITLDGNRKITTLSYLGNTTLRMDLAESDAEVTWPQVAPGGGGYAWTLGGTALLSGSMLRYYEAWVG